MESQARLRLREDLAAALGSDFTLAVDGPMLPTPAIKLVAEVYDPVRLEHAFEALVEAVKREAVRRDAPVVDLEHEHAAGRTYHRLRIAADGRPPFEVHYTFTDGYLVAAASRALVQKAIAVRESGRNLARSSRFMELWPADGRTHVSALVYQNLAAIAGAAGASGLIERRDQGRGLAEVVAQVKPSLVYASGEEDRIQVAGDLFNFDPGALAVPAFLQQVAPSHRSVQ